MGNFHEGMKALARDVRELQQCTGSLGWDRPTEDIVSNPSDLGAKPIGYDQWHTAMKTALKLGTANPWLPTPVPGADPEGFVWLTYARGDRKFELAIKKDRFEFILNDESGRRSFTRTFSSLIQSSVGLALREVSEALRALLPSVN